MRCRPRPCLAALAAIAALAVSAPAAVASTQATGPQVVPPYAELSALWWQVALGTPTAHNPLLEEGRATCSLGQGRVRFLFATFTTTTQPSGDVVGSASRHCSVPSGTLLFLPALNGECSAAEGYGTTDAALRACAAGLIDPVDPSSLVLTVDGVALPTFRVASPLFEIDVPADNVIGVAAGRTPAVSDGWWALLAPLRRGRHVVTFGGSAPLSATATFTTRVTYTIRVRGRGR